MALVALAVAAGACGQQPGVHGIEAPSPDGAVVAAPQDPAATPVRPVSAPRRPATQAPAERGRRPPAVFSATGTRVPALAQRRCKRDTTRPLAPLTGARYDVEAIRKRPVLAVKIENSRVSRPQTGLDYADVVVEHLVEGGITRFTALFHSCVPEMVGPVRSVRPVDADFLPTFDPLLAYSGGRQEVVRMLRRAGVPLLADGVTPGFFRYGGRRAPHNLYARTLALHRAGRGLAPPAQKPGWQWERKAPTGAPATEVTVRMSQRDEATWRYDVRNRVYRRLQNGRAHTVTGGGRIGVANVVVLRVPTRDGGCCDTSGARYVDIDVIGRGPMVVLRDGVRVRGQWRHAGAEKPLRFLAADGNPLPLRPGRTWIMLAPR